MKHGEFGQVSARSLGPASPSETRRLHRLVRGRWAPLLLTTLLGCAPGPSATVEEGLAAGSNDRYGCVTTSQPGCDLSVGTGQSLFGADECKPDVDFKVTSEDVDRTHPLILAIHGGDIEDGTAQLADALGSALGWDRYVFRARRVSATCGDTRWMHVTSERFNSATARQIASAHPLAVSLHGYEESSDGRASWPQDRYYLCVGGRNATARAAFIGGINSPALTIDGRRVTAFDATGASNATSAICGGLQGVGDNNVVNLPAKAGIQLELPRGVRARLVGLDGEAIDATLRDRFRESIVAALL